MSSNTAPQECVHGSNVEQVQSNQTNIKWHENYIRTKLYAYQGVDQNAYDALVVSLLAPSSVDKTHVEH